MGRYVARRVLQMVPVLIGTTFLIFAMVWALPGDPFAGRCGQRACPPAFVQAETQRLHLDKPLPVQYAYYMAGLAKGDFGTTSDGTSVATEVKRAYPITLKLTYGRDPVRDRHRDRCRHHQRLTARRVVRQLRADHHAWWRSHYRSS